MNSTVLLVVIAICFLAVVGLLTWLFLSQQRTNRQSLLQEQERMAQTLALQTTFLQNQRESLEQQAELAAEQAQRLVMETVKSLTSSQETQTKAMQQLHLTSLNGSQASESSMTKVLQSALAMLGTKDTLAFASVMGAPSATLDSNPGDPYPAVDDTVQQKLDEDFVAEQNATRLLLERMGITDDARTGE